MQKVPARSTGVFDPLSATTLGEPHLPYICRRYQIGERLGTGATCSVYRAFDAVFDRPVAVKVLHHGLLHDPVARSHFYTEAKSLARLSSPHVVAVLEYGDHDGEQYLVLEYIVGTNLERLVARNPMNPESATRVSLQACEGVRAAHAAGIVHRDIKPANLLLTESGAVKLIDFGLSCSADGDGIPFRGGTVAGTPSFMSPEQCLGAAVDERSDIYALGATYFTLLTGVNPYGDQESPVKVMRAHRDAPPPDPQRFVPEVPTACAAIVQRAMAKRPQDRYQTVDELASELQAALADQEGRRHSASKPALRASSHGASAGPGIRGQFAFTACVAGVLAGFAAVSVYLGGPALRSERTAEAASRPSEVTANEPILSDSEL